MSIPIMAVGLLILGFAVLALAGLIFTAMLIAALVFLVRSAGDPRSQIHRLPRLPAPAPPLPSSARVFCWGDVVEDIVMLFPLFWWEWTSDIARKRRRHFNWLGVR